MYLLIILECIDCVNACINIVDAETANHFMQFKKYEHNPPHVFIENCKYFITSSIFNKMRLLKRDETKLKLLEYIKKSVTNYNWKLEEWVILDNHYHLMLESDSRPESLSKIMAGIHRYSAIWIKKNVQIPLNQIKIWHNYWDKCLTYDSSYFSRLNYIWYNPVKHKYVDEPQMWKFGSYFERYESEKSYLKELKEKYPFDNLKINDDF